ncbi:MAG: hypothetical protein IKQ95_10260 [Synergistaceae bacterium]|nr:hypothetical protein [Synergistaceae bacterium]
MASDDVARIEALLREHFARTDKQLSDMRADNAEFRAEMVKLHNDFAEKQNEKFDAFAEKQDAKFEAFTQKTDAKFEAFSKEIRKDITELKSEVVELRMDVTGLKHDVAGLYHWNYWTLSIIIAVVAMPQIMAGLKHFFVSAAEIVAAVIGVFRKNDKA